jgi:hypothetical protein
MATGAQPVPMGPEYQLKANWEGVKVAQELMRSSKSPPTMNIYTRALTPAKREAQSRVVDVFWTLQGMSEKVRGSAAWEPAYRVFRANPLTCWFYGGPDRDRTDDLFHAMEARSQLRHRPTKATTSFILAEHA